MTVQKKGVKTEGKKPKEYLDYTIREVLDVGLVLRYIADQDDIHITMVGIDKYILPSLLRKAAKKADQELGL